MSCYYVNLLPLIHIIGVSSLDSFSRFNSGLLSRLATVRVTQGYSILIKHSALNSMLTDQNCQLHTTKLQLSAYGCRLTAVPGMPCSNAIERIAVRSIAVISLSDTLLPITSSHSTQSGLSSIALICKSLLSQLPVALGAVIIQELLVALVMF